MKLLYIGSQGCEPAAQRSAAGVTPPAREFPSGTGRAGGDIYFERQDQRNESDISFLTRLSGDFGMNCKAHDGRLVLFDSEASEEADAVIEIPKTGGMYSPKSYSFKMSSSGTDYDRVEVAYTDPKTGKTQTAEAKSVKKSAKKKAAEKVLTVNQRVENPDQAQKLARAKLHRENQKEQTASLECMGNPALVAGRNVKLTGFGEFSGTWCIKSATHKLAGSGGYSTSLELTAPAPTKEGKTESFVREAGEMPIQQDDYSRWKNLATDQKSFLAALEKKVKESNCSLAEIIYCWPKIALAEAGRCWLDRDQTGWNYLAEFGAKWLSLDWRKLTYNIDDKTPNIPPSRISWDWLMKFPRAEAEYERFISPYLAHYVLNKAGKARLCEVLKEQGFYNLAIDQGKDFDFINYPFDQWKKVYVNYLGVDGFHVYPDGLVASLQSFTFRGLISGTIKRIEAGKYHVTVKRLAVFAHDVFNFEGDGETLGKWSCEHKNFTVNPLTDNSYEWLSNADFRIFSERFQTGTNFLVLSDAHIVEDFEEISYDCNL